MFKDFQKFLFRGNVIDLAVAVVVGGAFTAVVNSLVKDLFTPLIALIIGSPSFAHLQFTVRHAQFQYGDFLNAMVSFVVVAAAIFFLVVQPMKWLTAHMLRPAPAPVPPAPAPMTKACPECCSQIPLAARRCAFCTSVQPTAPV